jgi:hypothetical protein
MNMNTFVTSSRARRAGLLFTLGGIIGAGVGCTPNHVPPPSEAQKREAATDMAMVDTISDSGVRSAILVQHSLFPYHFVLGGETLNELGERDLAVLISHYRYQGGGELNIRRGDAGEALYSARIRHVQQAMRYKGVEVANVRITDAPPGGEGIASTEVLRALSRSEKQQAYESADMSHNGTDTGSNQVQNPTGGSK